MPGISYCDDQIVNSELRCYIQILLLKTGQGLRGALTCFRNDSSYKGFLQAMQPSIISGSDIHIFLKETLITLDIIIADFFSNFI